MSLISEIKSVLSLSVVNQDFNDLFVSKILALSTNLPVLAVNRAGSGYHLQIPQG